MELSVNVEAGPRWWYAHVAELPGCFIRSHNRWGVVDGVHAAIVAHLTRLEEWGLETPDYEGIRVVEEIHDVPELGESGGAVALFRTDMAPVAAEELNTCVELMQRNRVELLNLIQAKPFEAKPIPEKRSIAETLKHIANAEEWYISRMGAWAEKEYKAQVACLPLVEEEMPSIDRLIIVREGATHTIRVALKEKMREPFTRSEYTRYPEEQWSYRKVLRRFVEHEREHISTIQAVIDSI